MSLAICVTGVKQTLSGCFYQICSRLELSGTRELIQPIPRRQIWTAISSITRLVIEVVRSSLLVISITSSLIYLLQDSCRASEYSLLPVVEHLDLEYFRYQGVYRDSYYISEGSAPGDSRFLQMQAGSALNLRLRVLQYLYWDNRFHMDMDTTSQVRAAGWQWEGGLHIPGTPVDLYEHHHSRHVLDRENPRGDKFPLENTYGIRLRLIGE